MSAHLEAHEAAWAGVLARTDYERYVMPVSAKVFESMRPYGVPMIHFGAGMGELLTSMSAAGRTWWAWTGECRLMRPQRE